MASAKKTRSSNNFSASAEGLTGMSLLVGTALAAPAANAFFTGFIGLDAFLIRYAAALFFASIACLIVNRIVANYRFDNSVRALQRRREVLIRQQIDEQRQLLAEIKAKEAAALAS